MNFEESKRKTVEHYAWVASMDKAYAWWAVNDWARKYPSWYGDLPALLTTEMERRRDAAARDSPLPRPGS